jgi:leucyl-tRNA synthetase
MKRYNPKEIEPKWQQKWAADKIYQAQDFSDKQKFVMLTEFPYPSGDGLHMGHMREYTLGDIMARHKRMQGLNVLFPMGYDAFGLPTENYAIKNKIAPQVATDHNVANFQKQFEAMGFSFDWSRSFRTTDPDYYKWTQWLFLQFFKKGLAYQKEVAINWCPFCKTGLSNEEVINGRHERCDTPVEKKLLKQWLLKITDYADRLIDGLSTVDYPSRIADQQINWIGRSKGASIKFKVESKKSEVEVFTTRPDTIFGTTFLVLAPEHPLVQEITTMEQKEHVNSYIKAAQAKSDIERQDTDREKTGVFTGAYAINPANNQKIPIWIADYVLTGYGTGAIMAVPAHDERDREFAQKFNLPIIPVIEPKFGEEQGDETHKKAIIAIVRNPSTNEVLVLDWGPRRDRWGGTMFIGGGADEDEDLVEAAKREIAEETGYTDLELVAKSASLGHSYYYSNVKNRNDHAYCVGLLFDLKSQNKVDQSLDEGEKGKFVSKWIKISDAPKVVSEGGLHNWFFNELVLGNAYTAEGIMTNSGEYDGLNSSEAREKIVADLVKKGVAKEKVNYRLRDWIFSRQHYWGEPIPIIHCPKCGAVAVPDDQLPVTLPKVDHYEPTDTGESPLAAIDSWVNTTCPNCKGPAKRETDTMPNWAGSSWYYLRYYDPHNDKFFADRKKLDYWGEVDMYLGGMEHTTLHLLYSRFWHQFFYDQGLVPTPEPYQARRGQGIILAADGSKMSKSKGNVINPTEIIDAGYGADALRLLTAFLAPYDQTTPWNPEGVAGTHRFLNRLWTLVREYKDTKPTNTHEQKELLQITHKTIKKVSDDLQDMNFNTPIASLMAMVNELYKIKADSGFTDDKSWQFALTSITQLLAPFAPHICEELWHELNQKDSIHTANWPEFDPAYLASDIMKIVVQVNGKVRSTLEVATGTNEDHIMQLAKQDEKVASYLSGNTIKKSIYVPNKLVNFVV